MRKSKKSSITAKTKLIKKHNSLTDGYIPKTPKQVLPDRLLNALYYKFEREGEEFVLSLTELKHLLGIPKEKNNERIYEAITILQAPIQIRNFYYKGRHIEWLSAPFLCKAIHYRNKNYEIEFKIDPMVIEAVKQKGGYTPLDIDICNRFKTKFGLKLYEMYKRYNSLPNNSEDSSIHNITTVHKKLDELNRLFSTHYKSPSKLLAIKETKTKPPINRGLEEIEKVTGEKIFCFYDKASCSFVFSWEKKLQDLYPSFQSPIPTKSLEPFAQWYIDHFIDKTEDKQAYLRKIIEEIKQNTFHNLFQYYQLYLLDMGLDPIECFDNNLQKFLC